MRLERVLRKNIKNAASELDRLSAENSELQTKISAMISTPAFNKMSDELALVRAENAAMRETLEFYANGMNWKQLFINVLGELVTNVDIDQGHRAREALAKLGEKG